MLEDSSDDSELEVDVVEISDTNSEATRSPSSPSKRPFNRPQRKSLDTSKGAKMNVAYSQPSLINMDTKGTEPRVCVAEVSLLWKYKLPVHVYSV